ncbi:MAG: plastocyanin/azurin family copper-binding protein [Ilumatobacteraceae bacterium]
MFFGKVLVAGLAAVTVLAACGDDANDQGVAARQLEARLAASRTATTVTTDAPVEASTDDVETTAGESAAATTVPAEPAAPAVEPTGVLVPVIALDNSFRPEVIEVEVGDEVVWENRGLNEHDVLYVQDSAADFGVEVADFQPGSIYSHVFTEAGEFHYYCSIHGNETVGMVGTVIVTG